MQCPNVVKLLREVEDNDAESLDVDIALLVALLICRALRACSLHLLLVALSK